MKLLALVSLATVISAPLGFANNHQEEDRADSDDYTTTVVVVVEGEEAAAAARVAVDGPAGSNQKGARVSAASRAAQPADV